MKRRDLLKMFGVAPAVILTPGLLMPIHSLNSDDEYYSHLSDLNGNRIRKYHIVDYEIVFNPSLVVGNHFQKAMCANIQ